MTSLASVHADELKNRRQKLKRRRQVRFLQRIWRLLLIGSITGSVVWVVKQPNWVISQPEQITIKGNHLLSVAAIRSLIPLAYPQPLLEIEPQKLSKELEATAPIEKVRVTRTLLPPSLTLEVDERQPVAIALPASSQSRYPTQVGILDAQGVWIAKESYTRLENNPDLPELLVIGFAEELRPQWQEIYGVVEQSTVKIFEIDLRSPNNLILRTELGEVHLGSYQKDRFQYQLDVLGQMRELPNQVQSSQMDYLDLSNPQSPAIQLLK